MGSLDADLLLSWYTLAELAERFRISPKTLRNWLYEARKRGFGPLPEHEKRVQFAPRRWYLLLRADYALELHSRFARPGRPRRRRVPGR